MTIKPIRPIHLADRKRTLHAVEIVDKGLLKVERLLLEGDRYRSQAVFNGLIGYLISQNIKKEHLIWASNELRSHANGGQA